MGTRYHSVPSFIIECPFGVGCRGLNTCLLHIILPFWNLFLNKWNLCLTKWIMLFVFFLCLHIYIYIYLNDLSIRYLPYFHVWNSILVGLSTCACFLAIDLILTLYNKYTRVSICRELSHGLEGFICIFHTNASFLCMYLYITFHGYQLLDILFL